MTSIKDIPIELTKIILDIYFREEISIQNIEFGNCYYFKCSIFIFYHNLIIKKKFQMIWPNKTEFSKIIEALTNDIEYFYIKDYNKSLIPFFKKLQNGNLEFLGNEFPGYFKNLIKPFILELEEICTKKYIHNDILSIYKGIDFSNYKNLYDIHIPSCFKILTDINIINKIKLKLIKIPAYPIYYIYKNNVIIIKDFNLGEKLFYANFLTIN